jgi:hypothetical protein
MEGMTMTNGMNATTDLKINDRIRVKARPNQMRVMILHRLTKGNAESLTDVSLLTHDEWHEIEGSNPVFCEKVIEGISEGFDLEIASKDAIPTSGEVVTALFIVHGRPYFESVSKIGCLGPDMVLVDEQEWLSKI